MKRIIIVFFIFTTVLHFYSEKRIITLNEVIKPDIIKIDKDHLYIAQGGTVFIYSRPGFLLKNKFGKKGEDPKEFKFYSILETGIDINILPDQILVGSEKKVSQFTKAGQESAYIRNHWQDLKKVIAIPAEFPAIKRVLTDKGLIYVQTYQINRKRTVFFVFDSAGKVLKTVSFPLKYTSIIDPYLYTIHDGNLYQLIDDGEEETWRLEIY